MEDQIRLKNQLETPAKGTEIELKIESLAFGGSGIGRFQMGNKLLTVFVEDTVPGDIVKVRLGNKKRNYIYGYVLEYIQKSPERTLPRCKHFGGFDGDACGGCSLQFLPYEQQLQLKEQHVRDALQRIGGFDQQYVQSISGQKDTWFYRNKMEFSFSKTQEGVLNLGLHIKRRHYDVVELTECFLMNAYIGGLVQKVRNFFRDLQQEEVILRSLIVREGKNSGDILVNLVGENGSPSFLEAFTHCIVTFFHDQQQQLNGFSKLTSVYFTNIRNEKGKPKSLTETLLWGDPMIREFLHIGSQKLQFQILPQAFFQPNTQQAETLYEKTLQAAALTGKEVVFDLFCGTGTIGILCASHAKKVYGIEINPSAIENARKNAELNQIKNIDFLVGDVDRNVLSLPEKPDVIIVDPPRNGLLPSVIEKIVEFEPKRIVYVSCSPPSLARDLKIFCSKGYELLKVQPVDMFPQTYHIENIASLQVRDTP